ncbi:MAG: MMPL family transporter [Myxococcota bacterium]
MKGSMSAYVRFVLGHRALILGLCGVVTVAALALIVTRGSLGSSLGKLFLGETPEWNTYLERVRDFQADEAIIVALADTDLTDPAVLDRLEAAGDAIMELPEVGWIQSPLSVSRIARDEDSLQIRPYAELIRQRPQDAKELLAELASDPFGSGLVVSPDGRHSAFVIELIPDTERPAERGPELVGEVTQAFIAHGFPADSLHRVGFLALLSQSIAETRYSIETLFPLVAIVLLAVVMLLFHRLWPVALSMGVSLIGVTWTMAFAVIWDPKINVMLAMAPAVILIVGFSDVIHLCSAYLLELSHGRSREDAIRASAVDVGHACLYTSLTTFVGFIGMTFVPTPAFRQLGWVLGFGVATALLLAMTLVPIAFSLMPTPKPWRVGATSRVQAALDGVLAAMSRLATRRARWVVAAFALVTAVAIAGASRVHIESRFTDRFAPDSPIRKDADFFAEHFAKANIIQLFVTTPEPGGLLEPETMSRLAAWQDELTATPGVESVISYADVLRQMHGVLADDPQPGALPDSHDALAQYTLLFEMSARDQLRRLTDFDRKTALVSVRVADEGMRAAGVLGDRLAERGREVMGEGTRVEATGIIWLMGHWLDEVITGQTTGFLFTFLVITLMMSLELRSLRLGLWSMVPNTVPLLVLGGVLGFMWEDVDSDTLAIAMLAIGIGVDDTIHFLMRYRIEAQRTDDPDEALDRAYDFAGRAIVMTTVTLALGFAPFATSSYYTTRILGTLLPMTLVVALVADLLLVPALARLGPLRMVKR